MVTMDSGVPYEQNVGTLRVTVVVLRAASNDIEDVRPLVPEVMRALAGLGGRRVVWVG